MYIVQEQKEPINKKILTIIALVVFISLVVGASFAFFASTQDGEGLIPVKVSTNTVDSLMLSVSKMNGDTVVDGPANIMINANQENFGADNGDLKGKVKGVATIKTSNMANHTAKDNYGLYFNIVNNNFVYSQNDESKPDLLLKVTWTDGEVTSIPGL